MDRLRRVTDLFVEGKELFLGRDAEGPLLVWVNKLNPFQAQEAARDAQARRFVAINELQKSGEYDGMKAELDMLPHDKLAENYVELHASEIYLAAWDDIDLDQDLKRQREGVERAKAIQDDAGVAEDSPERDTSSFEATWLARFQEVHAEKQREWLAEAKATAPAELKVKFLEKWREIHTHAQFEAEHRITQLFYALRECKATETPDGKWDHVGCNHSKRWLDERKEVHELPEALIEKALGALEELTVPARAAGNSDAPASSSESSEPSSAPEAPSTPSSPAVMPSGAPTT